MKNLSLAVIILCFAVLMINASFLFKTIKTTQQEQPLKGAPTGLYSTLSVATTTAVGPQQVKTIFSSNTQCTSRVVSTAGQAVMLTFGDPVNGDVSSTTLTSMVGHWQGASTTVSYDGGVYGCGRWSAFGVASSTITTVEFK